MHVRLYATNSLPASLAKSGGRCISIFVYVGSVVNGNQNTSESFTGTSCFFAIRTGLKLVGTWGMRYWPAAAKGAAARTAETPPIILRKSLRDIFAFLAEAPSNSVFLESLLQQFTRSLHVRQALEYRCPLNPKLLCEDE